MKITMNDTVKDVYANPIGHDILHKILMQMNIPSDLIARGPLSLISLNALAKMTGKILDQEFWPAFLHLMNQERGKVETQDTITPAWWKEAVFYQIYPRTFCDSNHDGIGDIQGIISRLDDLKELGIDALWLSPIYDSPMADNGYDIRDYRKINPEFGTMADFDQLLEATHKRNMKLIMDLVVNHTSDEHAWFQSAIQDENSPYRDYYFIRKHSDKTPNNWTSFFSGPAWDMYGQNKDWALHLFAKKQIDLNWDNPAVRKDIEEIISWWLDKGVDGFRMDVINYISKDAGLPEGDVSVGKLMGYTGIEHYYYGPHLHEYLHEIQTQCFEKYNAFSVGETPGLGMEMCKLVTDEKRRELNMVFSFDHLETPGHVRWDDYVYDLNYLRDYFIDYEENYGNGCWMSLFYNNHDNPKMISKIDPEGTYTEEIAKLLAVMQFTLKGTPFVYQGDELGLTNVDFHDISELNDVESINYYKELQEKGKTKEEAWKTILAGTRDHARMMMPWNEEAEKLPAHLKARPIARVRDFYRYLIHLRKTSRALLYGDFKVLSAKKDRFVYTREDDHEIYLIDLNLGKDEKRPYPSDGYEPLLTSGSDTMLTAYEARIYRRRK